VKKSAHKKLRTTENVFSATKKRQQFVKKDLGENGRGDALLWKKKRGKKQRGEAKSANPRVKGWPNGREQGKWRNFG